MEHFLKAKWQKLVMANYAVEPAVLIPFLPNHTELDFFEGKVYVSLVGFMFLNSKIGGLPIPLMGSFEEVNLRFYVKRKVNGEWRRGVVFVNETVPYQLVAVVANWLYKEHYTAIPTKHQWHSKGESQHVNYFWKKDGKWNEIRLEAALESHAMIQGSVEEFIFEHYYGYTKIDATRTEEYQIEHPSWEIYPVKNYGINCDFEAMYGQPFAHLFSQQPNSIMLAEGSEIAVKWKRNRL